ncbi:sigma-54-dependent Fis family transcriptional regulator [Myxococcus sp. CA051A]|uniref:sigma 54-interacting transcriptional regulator n=1 Tax=Myxococcus sp. CA051A TaxID=2741739 RepID=UPI00157B1CB7|nr:sigma-54 dependent transcriptional regulator [Myxococcus sp. CA051A]NTX66415.1 sigma-54-dependent Fis family transcriptional regulator [Myxococcus sp. CA051A]
MKQRLLDDVSTASPQRQGGDSQATAHLPALTLVSHPLASRVGERFVLESLARGKEVALSRNEPLFTRVGEVIGRPLADPFVSRRPLRFLPRPEGGVRLEGDAEGTQVMVGGVPGVSWDFRPEALAAGVTLELAGRVVLLLHRVAVDEERSADTLGMVGQSSALGRVRTRVRQVADLDVPVLIRGETGSGKELVARALHQRGPRRKGPFVSVNLGTLARELAAAELFGAQRGAYTGASQSREGFFRAAHGGTLFLDEVGEAPAEVQVALLRVLETGEVYPVGAHTPIATDVRLVAATDAPLEDLIEQGRFRAPLLHRLSGYSIQMPPLRERREDISLLFHHFARVELEGLGEAWRLEPTDPYAEPWLPAALASRLLRHDWPGNVRQLRNVARQLVISGRGQARLQVDAALEAELAPKPSGEEAPIHEPTLVARRKPSDVTEPELLEALRECSWDLKNTAEKLGITRASLYNLVDRSPHIRTVKDLGAEEITRCFQACGGDLDAMVRKLEVSRRALQRRVRELGLEPPES